MLKKDSWLIARLASDLREWQTGLQMMGCGVVTDRESLEPALVETEKPYCVAVHCQPVFLSTFAGGNGGTAKTLIIKAF